MKYFSLITVLVLVLSSTCRTQFKQGDVELSLNGSAGTLNEKSSYTSTGYSSTQTTSNNFFVVSLTCGVFIYDGFSIEPEVGMIAIEQSSPAQFVIGNLAYTYLVPNSKVAVFFRGGYGVSNAFVYPFLGDLPIRYSNKYDIGIINVGGGVKCLISEHAALRVELNYRKQTYSKEYSSNYNYSSKYEYTYSNYGVLVGFSILL